MRTLSGCPDPHCGPGGAESNPETAGGVSEARRCRREATEGPGATSEEVGKLGKNLLGDALSGARCDRPD